MHNHELLFPPSRFPDVIKIPNLVRRINRIDIPPESLARLDKTRTILKENPLMSIVSILNHPSYNDPPNTVPIILSLDPENIRHWVILVSWSHTDSSSIKNLPFIWMTNMGKSYYGIEPIRVIQTYQVNNPKYPKITEKLAYSVNTAFALRLKEIAKTGKPIGVIIYPEGTRSAIDGIINDTIETGGVNAVGKLFYPTLYQSIGIYGNPIRNINIGRQYSMDAGVPYIQQKRSDPPNVFSLMHNLADTLPEEKRGKW